MEFEDAKKIVQELLKSKGKARNSDLTKALGGDSATFEAVKEDLIFENLAKDKDGVVLVYIEPSTGKADKPLRIFLSYGHDANEELVRRIKADLEERGHDVWFDKSGVKEQGIVSGEDWRRSITDGIASSHGVMSFLSKHSTRDPGVCLDEIAIAIGVKGGNIQTILVESEKEVQPPTSVSHIQWLDMSDWKAQKEAGDEEWELWYKAKFDEIVRVVESDESERFAGEIEKLNEFLKPISSDSRVRQLLKKGLVGREWLFKAAEEWRTDRDRSSRIFWLMGAPGVGKSAFAAYLSHYDKGRVIATHFCEYDKSDHSNPNRIVRTLAFQLATRLPDYRKLLLTLPEIGEVEGKNPSEAFDYLLATPLQQTIDGGRERYLIVIDALDEAKEKGRNELVEMLARNAHRLPEWIGILVTSRPEEDVTKPLQGLNPFVLDPDTKDNREDIRKYLRRELEEFLGKRLEGEEIIERITGESGGVFLLVERICLDVKGGHLSLDRLDEFPRSLGGTYWRFFERQFPDVERFKQDVRPALRSILAAREPLPLNVLQRLSKWSDEKLRDFTSALGSLFPVTEVAKQEVIKYYHRSISDWITDDTKAGPYYVSVKEGHRTMADFGWQEYMNGPDKMSKYSLAHLPRHLCEMEKWDEVETVLTDLLYIEARRSAGMTYDLVRDYSYVLASIPDAREDLRNRRKQEDKLYEYAHDLIEYAKGNVKQLNAIASVEPWDEDTVEEESRRIAQNPNRLDRLRLFSQFVGSEAHAFAEFREMPGLALQQAYNHAKSGPVAESAERIVRNTTKWPLLLQTKHLRPPFEPLPALLKTLEGHSDTVDAVDFTADGTRAVSGSADRTVTVWDLQTGQRLKILEGHDGEVTSVGMTPDGKMAVSGSRDRSVKVWNPETGECCKTLVGHTGKVTSVDLTPDGTKALSGSTDRTIRVWDLTNDCCTTLKGHSGDVNSVCVSAHGKRVISGSSDRTVKVWDPENGECLKTLEGHSSEVISLSMTPDGSRAVSGSTDGTVNLWNLAGGNLVTSLKGHDGRVLTVCMTPDGARAVSGSDDETFAVWNFKTARTSKAYNGHPSWVLSVSVSADGRRVVTGGGDKKLRLWNLESGQRVRTVKRQHSNWVNTVTAYDGKVISGSGSRMREPDNSIRIWDLENRECLNELAHSDPVYSVCVTGDGQRAVSGSGDQTISVWNPKTVNRLKTLRGHTGEVSSISLTPDGRRAVSGSADSTIRVWDLETGECINELVGHTAAVFHLALSSDGRTVVSGSIDRTLKTWDLASGDCLMTLEGHADPVTSVGFTGDGRRAVSGSLDKTLRVWNLVTGRQIRTLEGHSDFIYVLSISAARSWAVSGSLDRTIRVWDLDSGSLCSLRHTDGAVSGLEMSRSGERILYGTSNGHVGSLSLSHPDLGIPIITGVRLWLFGRRPDTGCWDERITYVCPRCERRNSMESESLRVIELATSYYELTPDQSPCLALPREAWDEPNLISECPECGGKLKFNPFIVDNRDRY